MWSRLYRTFARTHVAEPRAVFGRVLGYARPYRWKLAGAAACMMLLAGTTSAYAYLVGPLLRFIYTGGELPAQFGSIGSGVGEWLSRDPGNMAILLAGMVIGLAAVKGLAAFGELSLMGAVGQGIIHDIRRRMIDRVLSLSPDQIVGEEKGDLSSRFMIDVSLLESVVTFGLTALVRDLLLATALIGLALYLDPVLGLVAIAILPVTSALIVAVGVRVRRARRRAQDSLGNLSARVEETAAGLSVIRHHGAEAVQAARFAEANAAARGDLLVSIRIRAIASPLMELLGAAALAATLWYAQSRISSGVMTPERFVSFFTAIFLLYGPVKSLGEVANMLQAGLAGADRVFKLLDTPPAAVREGSQEAPPLRQALAFRDVRFSRGGQTILDGADFEVRAGERVALVGRSGAGKTTVAMIACRLLDHEGGDVTWDGVPIERYEAASVRHRIAVVPQEPFLFHDSVRMNVTLGAEAGATSVEDAARLAGLDPLLERIPGGLDGNVGEGGGRLSGGERQRVCLARALYHGGSVLLLDEAVSSLDAGAERELSEAIDRAAGGRTVLIVAHRLSSVRRADRIVVLEDGKMVESGRFEDLAGAGGAFARLFAEQLAAEAAGTPAEGAA